MLFHLVYCVAVIGQAQIRDLDQVAPTDVTVKLNKTVEQTAKDFDELAKKLKELKNPTKKEAGESNAEYLDRVNQIFKGRALYLHKLAVMIQENLEAKFRLQLYLDEYKDLSDAVAAELKILPVNYQKKADELKKELSEAGKDAIVLASIIKTKATSIPEKKALADAVSLMFDPAELDAIEDKNVRIAKFAPLALDKMEEKLEELINKVKDSRYEEELLSTTIITETKELADVLPKEHLNRIAEMKKVLGESKKFALEDRAAEVSILAKYYGAQLSFVEPENEKDFLTILKMDKQSVEIEKKLADFLGLSSSKTKQSGSLAENKDSTLKSILSDAVRPVKADKK